MHTEPAHSYDPLDIDLLAVVRLPPGPLPEPRKHLRRRWLFAAFTLGLGSGFAGGFLGGALLGALRVPPPIEIRDPAFHRELEKTITELQRATDFWREQAVACDGRNVPAGPTRRKDI